MKAVIVLRTVKIAGICALLSQTAAIVFLLLIGLLLGRAEDPVKNVFALSLLTATVVSFLGGSAAGYSDRNNPLICGLLCGVFSALISLALSVIPGGGKDLLSGLLLLLLTLFVPFFASLFGRKLSAGKRRTGRMAAERRKKKKRK